MSWWPPSAQPGSWPESLLRNALGANPASAPIKHALGLSLVRQQRVQEAMSNLAEVAQSAPDQPQFSYVYAVALHDTGSKAEAINVLKQSLARDPHDRDILLVLISYEVEGGDLAKALDRAEPMNRLAGQSRYHPNGQQAEGYGSVVLNGPMGPRIAN